MMKLGSLFDGSGGFPLAGALNDIIPAWAAEVEPYPIAVTRSRFPGMKHYGNVCDINGAEIEPVDIITAGSPCQDMSIAGLRAGIYEGKRSNLFFESIRIVKEMRKTTNGKYPRFFVWENVPGAFSSDKGGAFQAVLQAVCGVCDDTVSIPESKSADGADKSVWLAAGSIVGNGYSVAWRTLDAQYWGVPQRRARIYLVADFDAECAAEILFKPERVRGDLQKGDETRQEAAADALGGADGSNGIKCLNPWDCQSKRVFTPDGVYPTLPAMDCGGANNQAVIYPAIARTLEARYDSSPCIDRGQNVIALQANGIDRADNAGCNGCGWRENECYTLNTIDRHAVCFENHQHGGYKEGCGTLRASGGDYGGGSENLVCYGIGNGQADNTDLHDVMGALNCMHDQQAVVYPNTAGALCASGNGDGETELFENHGQDCRYTGPLDVCPIVSATYGMGGNNTPFVIQSRPPRKYIIRRLMPIECARLQGFPDAWGELAPYDGDDAFWAQVRKTHAEINGKAYKPVKDIKKWYDKLHNDGAEYKMWGNGIALPCAEYVIRMIKEEV